MKSFKIIVMIIMLIPCIIFAQSGNIKGRITDEETGQNVQGANVILVGTIYGAASDMTGRYLIENVPYGTYRIMVSFMGYGKIEQEISLNSSEKVINFELSRKALQMSALEVMASRASRETPVAYTNIAKTEMTNRLGSRDIPLILNTTPSVYSTNQGGGAGDARVNVRGFDQRNVAIMLNGVPVNDMENGWVYWSNWDGVGDATSSIQMQRGLSAVNLATPSVGGTMNIITDPAAYARGFQVKQEVGSYGFFKSTLSANSGLINDKYAFNGTIVRKTGEGYYGGTWTDAWAYYFGASMAVNSKNRLELYAIGAPQRHGQNLYKQNIAVYDQDFAKDLDTYDEAAFENYQEKGRDFNQNYAPVSTSYNGQQAVGDRTFDRHEEDILNSRENFYHKPQVNLNWYLDISDQLRLSTIAYYSGGTGGGTGTYGDVYAQDANGQVGDDDYKWYYGPAPWKWNWNETIAMNQGAAGSYYINKEEFVKEDGESIGILRNSRNNQNTIGAISKLYYDFSDELKMTVGIDWRTAEIEHYREVRDLLGGEFFVKTADDFNPNEKVGLGDKIAYNFTNNVDWLGTFAQADYNAGPISAYGMAGYSMVKYTHTNHFKKDDSGDEVFLESDYISGMQVKAGAGYNVLENVKIYGNFGFAERVPIFDNVISDYLATKSENPENEKFFSVEGGINMLGMLDNKFSTKLSLYHTSWKDRANSLGITEQDGTEAIIFLTGMDALHQGVEFEATYRPVDVVELDASVSIGKWTLTDDVSGSYKDYDGGDSEEITYDYYVKDLKVGDAPQTQFALTGTVYPMKGLFGQLVVRYYDNHYAQWDPFGRTDPNDTKQSWMAPAYTLVDLHASYDLPITFKNTKFSVFAHVFNLLDATYIQDAVDNSQYNAFDHDHDADDAEVFFGLPRNFNIGISVGL